MSNREAADPEVMVPDATDTPPCADLGVPAAWWARLGHELRGPLGPMRMAVQVLRSGRGSADEQGEALALLDRQIDRLLVEIDDIADLVRARNGLALVRPRPGDLNLVLDPVSGRVALLRALAQRGQSLACVPADTDLEARHDPARLCALLEFLLRKAAAHAATGATLELRLLGPGEAGSRDGEAEFRIRGFDPSLFADPELAWMLGNTGSGVEQLAPRPVLMRELALQSRARLSADPAHAHVSLFLPLSGIEDD